MERRITGGECRIESREDGSRMAVGYGAVFYRAGDSGTEYELWKGAVERIARGAFSEALNRPDDVRGLFNHDSDHLLGRLSAETLRLRADDRGLLYEIDLPDTQAGRDVATSIERGDLTGSSFAFVPEVVEWSEEEDREIRTIKSVRLYDVGPVTFPAYESSTTALRTDGQDELAKSERDSWKQGNLQEINERRNRSITARLRELDMKP